jgi:hypothetical protein
MEETMANDAAVNEAVKDEELSKKPGPSAQRMFGFPKLSIRDRCLVPLDGQVVDLFAVQPAEMLRKVSHCHSHLQKRHQHASKLHLPQ